MNRENVDVVPYIGEDHKLQKDTSRSPLSELEKLIVADAHYSLFKRHTLGVPKHADLHGNLIADTVDAPKTTTLSSTQNIQASTSPSLNATIRLTSKKVA